MKAPNRKVATFTGRMGPATLRLTQNSKKHKSSQGDVLPKAARKKKRQTSGAPPCDLCSSTYRSRRTPDGLRCFDCWSDERVLIEIASTQLKNHTCADGLTSRTCRQNGHARFISVLEFIRLRSDGSARGMQEIVERVESRVVAMTPNN